MGVVDTLVSFAAVCCYLLLPLMLLLACIPVSRTPRPILNCLQLAFTTTIPCDDKNKAKLKNTEQLTQTFEAEVFVPLPADNGGEGQSTEVKSAKETSGTCAGTRSSPTPIPAPGPGPAPAPEPSSAGIASISGAAVLAGLAVMI
jgi:hypothetical protein